MRRRGPPCLAPSRKLSSATPRNSPYCSAKMSGRSMPQAPKSSRGEACRSTLPIPRASGRGSAISTRAGGRKPARRCGAFWNLMPAKSADSAFRLDGKTAFVTGAGRGIGRATALALAAAGAELILVSRTPSELDEVVGEIASGGGKAQALPFDVTDSAAVRDAFAGLGRLDILVNNAGLNRPQPFLEVNEATLDLLLGLNVRAAFLVAQAAARLMVACGGGVIINMCSQLGHVGSELTRTVYVMTKHALEGLTKAMAVELAPKGVRVVSIAPTFITTPLTKPFFDDPAFKKWVLDRIPLGRLGTVEEVASAVVFLASPAASLVTGSSLLVDGGWTAW